MHIAQLLDLFAPAPHIEIIEASLPHVCESGLLSAPKLALRQASSPAPGMQHAPGKTLFEYLHNGRRSSRLRFADQDMKVFGHNHIAEPPRTDSAGESAPAVQERECVAAEW